MVAAISVFEVIDTVKRVSGVDFRVELADRRPGDPAQIVAASDRARDVLHWVPRYDDLPIIVRDCAGMGTETADAEFVAPSDVRRISPKGVIRQKHATVGWIRYAHPASGVWLDPSPAGLKSRPQAGR